MLNENGHSNGALALADSLTERRQEIKSNVRAMIATLADHNARGIPLKQELVDAYQIVCARLMQSQSERIQAVGVAALAAALKYNLDLFTQADKMTRLDSDQPTERVEHTVLRASFK